MVKLRIRKNRLTDGGHTYDVIISDHEEGESSSRAVIQLEAITHGDAIDLIQKIRSAIDLHTNTDCEAFANSSNDPRDWDGVRVW